MANSDPLRPFKRQPKNLLSSSGPSLRLSTQLSPELPSSPASVALLPAPGPAIGRGPGAIHPYPVDSARAPPLLPYCPPGLVSSSYPFYSPVPTPRHHRTSPLQFSRPLPPGTPRSPPPQATPWRFSRFFSSISPHFSASPRPPSPAASSPSRYRYRVPLLLYLFSCRCPQSVLPLVLLVLFPYPSPVLLPGPGRRGAAAIAPLRQAPSTAPARAAAVRGGRERGRRRPGAAPGARPGRAPVRAPCSASPVLLDLSRGRGLARSEGCRWSTPGCV